MMSIFVKHGKGTTNKMQTQYENDKKKVKEIDASISFTPKQTKKLMKTLTQRLSNG
jgi:hypothetical protein